MNTPFFIIQRSGGPTVPTRAKAHRERPPPPGHGSLVRGAKPRSAPSVQGQKAGKLQWSGKKPRRRKRREGRREEPQIEAVEVTRALGPKRLKAPIEPSQAAAKLTTAIRRKATNGPGQGHTSEATRGSSQGRTQRRLTLSGSPTRDQCTTEKRRRTRAHRRYARGHRSDVQTTNFRESS